MKFINIKDEKPLQGQTVLIKPKEKWPPYYVCSYYETERGGIFEEAAGERYSYWKPDEIIGWAPIEEIEKEQEIVHCKDCIKRYDNILCPLAQMNETYDEDDGHDYFYTWGNSEDDDFYCAEGKIEKLTEE